MKTYSLILGAVTALTMTSVSHAAKVPSVQQQLQALQKMLEQQQAQLEAQRQQLAQQQAELQALRAAAGDGSKLDQDAKSKEVGQLHADVDKLEQAAERTKLAAQEAPRWTLANGRPLVTSADGRSSLAVRALVQADLGHYDQDPAGSLASDYRRGSTGATGNRETTAARDLSDRLYFRRARFGVEGIFARDFTYRLVMELGGAGTEGPTRINDAYVGYTGLAPFTFQIGAFSPPANLEDSTTPDDQLFPERATPAELSRALAGADGRVGVGVRGNGNRWYAALTYTLRTVNDAEVFDSQTALVGRAAALIATGNDYNLHLGVSGTYVIRPADQGADVTGARYGIRFRDRPELRIDSTRLIDTGTINADHAYAAGVEFAGNWRNFFLQAEKFWFGIERPKSTTLSNPEFDGYYVEGSWVMTGEAHRYNMSTASYQNPRPNVPFSSRGGWGAWELAFRYSHTNLNSNAGILGNAAAADSVRGGEQNIYTVGLNWCLNANLKLLFDYSRIMVDRLNPARTASPTPFGDAPGTPPFGVQIGQDLNTYGLRTQFSF